MKRGLFVVLVMVVSGGTPASAQLDVAIDDPAGVGMSEKKLQEAVALLRSSVAEENSRGAVLLVARRGKTVVHEAFGWKDKENGLPMDKDTLFRMASNTKPTIATAVLMLAEEGELELDAAAAEYLPSFDNDRARGITVRHLLTHTSGLRISKIFLTPLIERSAEHPRAPNLQLEVARFGKIGAEVAPGTSYSYSNPGYNTLGALVEVASDRPLAEFLRERIYAPLEMTDSSNHESVADNSRMSKVYRKRDGQWIARWKPGDAPQYPFVRASGGMISTAVDYARFCQMFLSGGSYEGKRLLTPESVSAATSPQTKSIFTAEQLESQDSFYGYGWSVANDGSFSHGGSDGTHALVDPKRELIVLVFTQSPSGGKNPREEVIRLAREACVN